MKRLLASGDSRRGTGGRDYSILTVLIRLGLRAGEVAALTVDDLDLRAGEMTVRGKGGREDRLPIPVDVVCAKEFSADARATVKDAKDVAGDDLILDIGPRTAAQLAAILGKAGTIVWQGPGVVFEFEDFGGGT